MKRRWIVVVVTALLGGCPPSPATDEHAPPSEHEGEHEHEDEPGHGEVPRRVRLDEHVQRDAEIQTEAVGRRAIEPTVRLPGEITADPDRRARVGARVAGIVESVAVGVGDRVEKGDVLAVIRAPDLQVLRAAEASLRARGASARANAERLRTLVDKGMAAAQEATAAEAEAEALEAEAGAARERLRAIGARRSRRGPILFEVHTPRAGVVIEREVAVGAPVTPQSVIATVVSLDEVWFVAHVFERDVARVREGRAAAVVLNAYAGETFDGEVTYVSYEVDPGARTLSARIPLRNEGERPRLRLGLYGTAFVATGEPSEELGIAVPRSAVLEVLGSPTVFVRQADGDFERHEVVLGRADTTHVEVVHGLREGEQVVTRGAFSIKAALLRHTIGDHH